MKLSEVVPWGRTLEEYRRMFGLTDTDLQKRILGVGDGPASFNAEMTAGGHSVISIDPIYAFSAADLNERIEETHKTIINQLYQSADHYNWTTFRNPEDVVAERMKAMTLFLSDYSVDQQHDRYRSTSLPCLPFLDQEFDLALCSHLLFLYSEQLSQTFHLESIHELTRVAKEVRIFPLIALDGQLSPYLTRVLDDCQEGGIKTELIDVDYHFQKGANQLLRLTKTATQLN